MSRIIKKGEWRSQSVRRTWQGGQELPTTNCTTNCQSISAEFDITSMSVTHYLIVITVRVSQVTRCHLSCNF